MCLLWFWEWFHFSNKLNDIVLVVFQLVFEQNFQVNLLLYLIQDLVLQSLVGTLRWLELILTPVRALSWILGLVGILTAVACSFMLVFLVADILIWRWAGHVCGLLRIVAAQILEDSFYKGLDILPGAIQNQWSKECQFFAVLEQLHLWLFLERDQGVEHVVFSEVVHYDHEHVFLADW